MLEQLQELWGGYWGRAEWTAGNEKHKIWVDFRSGKVLMASRAQEPSVYVKDLRRRAAKNEKAATAAGKAENALAVVEKAVGEMQSATARAANKGASESEHATAVKAARSASAKAQESLREFAKDAGEAEKALGSSCSLGTRQQEKQAGCWRKGTLCRGGDGEARALEQARAGRRVGTLPQEERAGTVAPRLEIDPELWREVFLVRDDVDNGGVLSIALLRPLAWLNEHKVEVGAWVQIDLREMGVCGEALVTAVQPCPAIEEGEGCLVTGTFRRSKALVLELKVAGESEVLGVTGNHLVWSEDRQDWVAMKKLCVGERLRAWDGSTPEVESLTACSEPEPVYNIEVEGDHCYRVGEQGLLVHNASNPCDTMGINVGFANRDVDPHNTRTFTAPSFGPPGGPPNIHSATFTITIPRRVVAKLVWQQHSGSQAEAPLRWAFTGATNHQRIGVYVATNDPRNDTVGHIVARTLGGNGRRNDGGLSNLYAQSETGNNQLSQLEQTIKNTLANPNVCSVCIRITFSFQSTRFPDRPSTLRYEWWFETNPGYTGATSGAETISNALPSSLPGSTIPQ